MPSARKYFVLNIFTLVGWNYSSIFASLWIRPLKDQACIAFRNCTPPLFAIANERYKIRELSASSKRLRSKYSRNPANLKLFYSTTIIPAFPSSCLLPQSVPPVVALQWMHLRTFSRRASLNSNRKMRLRKSPFTPQHCKSETFWWRASITASIEQLKGNDAT